MQVKSFENPIISSAHKSLGVGVGLRIPHYNHVIENNPQTIDWYEIISENYMGLSQGKLGGRPLAVAEEIRKSKPLVMHGVSLSIGSVDALNKPYLLRLKELAERLQPEWISDHICWTGVEGENLHDLLPLPYTQECLNHLCSRIQQVQEILGRPLVLENVSSYLTYKHSCMTEWDFLNSLCKASGCSLLLDLNNIYVSSVNHDFDAQLFLNSMDPQYIAQFHLAGHSNKGTHLVDTHDNHVCPEVWELYQKALKRFGPISTLVEWDDRIPEFQILEKEAQLARGYLNQYLMENKNEHTNTFASSSVSRTPTLDEMGAH